jgi:transcription antitermination factor NusG
MATCLVHPDADNPLGQWYAVQVKPRSEQAVATSARNKGYDQFLPLYSVSRSWSDRTKRLDLPLFPGYLFCRLGNESWLPLLKTPGVCGLVGAGRVPIPIDDDEIDTIQACVRSGLLAEPHPFLRVGQSVRLQQGPLAGMEGFYVQDRKRHRIVVSVALLHRSVGIEIDREWVEPI